ncbi:MAG TPA: hypothetical protein VMH22_12665 [bacterium]|nr:hypothetical protein [bacterium]
MRSRWLVVVTVASLCLNAAVVGVFVARTARRFRHRRLAWLAPEVRQKLVMAREAAVPEFANLAGQAESTDSLLWTEIRRESPDSARVESLCQDLGRTHGRMRAMVFRQVHRELQLLPATARAEYLDRMMRMRPGLGALAQAVGWRQRFGPGMPPPPGGGPPPDVTPKPPPESGH